MNEEITKALVDLTTEVRRSNERLASIEAKQDAQARNVEVFWQTHWPAVTKRLDKLEKTTLKLDDEISDLRVVVAKNTPRKAAKSGALVVGGGATVAGLLEVLRHFFGGDK